MFISNSKLIELANHGADCVVVGAGPAGITLALRLSRKGKKVLLLEAGGEKVPSASENDPYVGEVVARPYPLTASRLRYFGGSSNHWGGWVRPLDKEDFEPRDGIEYSGWPITREELDPYYDVAHEVCEVDGKEYDPSEIDGIEKFNLIDFSEGSSFRNSIFRFSPPTRFGQRYKEDIENSQTIFCSQRTQLIRLKRDDSGSTALEVLGPDGNLLIVKARRYVLAMGGVENARSLLYSNTFSNNSFGSDWVGRAFMDHFALTTSIVLSAPAINYDRSATSSGDVMARIAPSALSLSNGGGNLMMDLYPTDSDTSLSGEYLQNTGLFGTGERGWHYKLRIVTGHRPYRDSRVQLGDELDNNGVPRTVLDWNIAEEDFQNAFSYMNKFALELGATAQGRMKVEMKEAPAVSRPLGVGMHHIGTTRMAASAEEGVVDASCKVFGTSDLYLAGSSVFSTSGYSNPTLTIVALAARLADHLAKEV